MGFVKVVFLDFYLVFENFLVIFFLFLMSLIWDIFLVFWGGIVSLVFEEMFYGILVLECFGDVRIFGCRWDLKNCEYLLNFVSYKVGIYIEIGVKGYVNIYLFFDV